MQTKINSLMKLMMVPYIALSVLVGMTGPPLTAAQTKVPAQRGSGGTYRITAHGKQIGFEHFQTVSEVEQTTLTSDSKITVGEGQQRITSSLDLQQGNPVHYTVETGSGPGSRKYTLTFDAGDVKVKVESTGRTAERAIKIPAGAVVLDKDVWSHYRALFAKYDMTKKGLQSFQAFTPVPALRTYKVDVELDKATTFGSGSEKFVVNRFFVRLADGLGLIALVSSDGTPVDIEVPTQDIKITLE
jgi:hypothetical protein